MNCFLLLDFGTTSTKSALVDLDSGAFVRPQRYPALANIAAAPGHCEFDLRAAAARFDAICASYREQVPFAGIALCSEMHGFAVLDGGGEPLSNYLSWKDERSLEESGGGSAFAELAARLGGDFEEITGMKPRPGFAPMNFVHLARRRDFPGDVHVVDLPGWLCRASGGHAGLAHPTMLAGLAFYDVRRGRIAPALVEAVRQLTGITCHFDRPAPAGAIAGYWRSVPIYAGIGDHQCALLGAGLVSADTLSINLGTGAQVSVLAARGAPPEAETRPYFAGRALRTITHVPGGRALAEYMGFLHEIGGPDSDFWSRLQAVEVDAAERGDLDFGLALFPGAHGYRCGGYIRRIGEGRLTVDNYLASLLRAFAGQYLELARLFDPHGALRRCLLSGGIARRLPQLRQLVARATPYEVEGATALDESLLGLRAIALCAAGRAADPPAAQQVFGRHCAVVEGC